MVAEECPQHQRGRHSRVMRMAWRSVPSPLAGTLPTLRSQRNGRVVADQFEFEFGRIVRGTRGAASESFFC